MFGAAATAAREPSSIGDDTGLGRMIEEAVNARLDPESLTAWQHPTVVACRRLIATTVGQCPTVAMKGGQALPSQPVWLARPDRFETSRITWTRATNNLTRWGYYWLKVTERDAAGYPSNIRVLDAEQVQPQYDEMGRLTSGWVDGEEQPINGAITTDIHWVGLDVQQRGEAGRSPMEDCIAAVSYLSALVQLCGSFWESGYPSLALKITQRLNTEQRNEYKQELRAANSRRHEPWIIDRDGELVPVGGSPLESQLVESMDFADRVIARAFLIRPSLVNVSANDSLTYATTAEEFRAWKAVGLPCYLKPHDDGLTELLPAGTYAQHDTSSLDRSDPYQRAQTHTLALGGQPWMTIDEVRAEEGRVEPLRAPTTVPLRSVPNPTPSAPPGQTGVVG